jgi:hypothetical protein
MSKEINYQSSLLDVVNTMGLVLKGVIDDCVRKEIPNCSYVYDPDLSYETGLRRLRQNNQMNVSSKDPMPLFIFRRSALKHPDSAQAPNKRLQHSVGYALVEGENKGVRYTALHAEFDVDFIFVSQSQQEIEQFEITYLSEEGISGTREISVEIPMLGSFKYFLSFNELADLTINVQDNYYKALLSSMKVRGIFFIFRTEIAQILEINANIRAFYEDISANELMSTINIVPKVE